MYDRKWRQWTETGSKDLERLQKMVSQKKKKERRQQNNSKIDGEEQKKITTSTIQVIKKWYANGNGKDKEEGKGEEEDEASSKEKRPKRLSTSSRQRAAKWKESAFGRIEMYSTYIRSTEYLYCTYHAKFTIDVLRYKLIFTQKHTVWATLDKSVSIRMMHWCSFGVDWTMHYWRD